MGCQALPLMVCVDEVSDCAFYISGAGYARLRSEQRNAVQLVHALGHSRVLEQGFSCTGLAWSLSGNSVACTYELMSVLVITP